ncbi:MAG: hypothetical protein AAGE80_05615 [Pseudomonadota bacterium]
MNVNIDQEDLLSMAAEKLADEYADHASIGQMLQSKIRERVDDAIKTTIDDRVEAALNAALSETLDQTIQPVDVFGEKTGEPTTLRATLSQRAKDFWSTKVDRNGKPVGNDTWGSREAKTRAEWMLGKIVSDEFASQVRENAVEIAATFKEAMRKDAHAMIDKHIDGLIKAKSAK